MEGEPDLPAPPAEKKFFKPNLSRPININPESINLSRTFNTTSTCTSTTTSSASSTPDWVRTFQAACKRHRPLGKMQSTGISMLPRRGLVSQRETPNESNTKPRSAIDVKTSKDDNAPHGHRSRGSIPQSKTTVSVSEENREGAPITPSSEWGTTLNTHEGSYEPYNTQRGQPGLSMRSVNNDAVASTGMEHGKVPAEVQRKVHFSTENIATSRGANDRMPTGTGDLLSHMDSLALTEMEWDVSNQGDASAAVNQDWQQNNFQNTEMDNGLRSSVQTNSSLARKTMGVQEQMHQFGNFFPNDLNNAMTQSSGIGFSCVTSTLVNSTTAPMISSTTYSSQAKTGDPHLVTESVGEAKVLSHNAAVNSQAVHKSSPKKPQNSSPQDYNISKNFPHEENNTAIENVTDSKTQPQSSKVPPLDAKLENSKSEKVERGGTGKATSTSRRKGYDPDLFFKVNGKLYQRLGKIGSGGSSEVHKVISSDCTIYALKKIKLKGRDYATAYGFCQEIEYLTRLKGKNNIIQLIDYEVTDKTLLEAVMNGSMSNKDGRVKDDGYIYMVLEYGEIDLAHMLSQKWKELDGSNATIDQNWLRFYWQQILQAVNTIHEERIVHSDLKPANFLLVRGSLKLIDFGIAKAIMSDTTNIQRDSQVGTLSYMSPEAFMCNETDANGNTIKCGRPSDIWSLGCILYQMVYGRTPFSEYKTFWAKFKVITDPNHVIVYEPLPNPWLLDLMKKCLAWDRNERWRIPELLQHPFLVPPVPPKLPNPSDQNCTLFQLIAESSANDQTALNFSSQLQSMLMEPKSVAQSEPSMSRDQLRKLLCKISTVCFQLQEHLASL